MVRKRRRDSFRRRIKRMGRTLQRNDVVLRIYVSFAFILAFTGILIGLIFVTLYEKSYIGSYTELLTRQGKIIANHVARFERKEQQKQFEKYSIYVDQLERAENTDVWIVANPKAKNPLDEGFTNADADVDTISDGARRAMEKVFKKAKVASNSSYDEMYAMTTLNVVVPVKDKRSGEISGAVMMVSMIDRQTMGLEKGKKLIYVSIGMAIIFAFIVSGFFSRQLSRPLGKIGYHIAALAKEDYSGIEVKRPHSQIGILEKSLDRLAGELRKAATERENVEQIRRDFFANVSHELRTPITVLRGYTETLADGILEKPEQIQELHQRMLQECQGMERLVEDLFVLSKMQNPDFQMEMEPVSLQQIFGDVMRNGRILAKEKGIHMEYYSMEEDPCLVMGDYGRLRQMFMVIVDNAVKFSLDEGTIEVSIALERGKYRVRIKDYGAGISKEQLPYIFEKFYTSKMRQNEKGTGLGLMIARQISLRHGAEIVVDSEEGKGTTFTFLFEPCTDVEDFV